MNFNQYDWKDILEDFADSQSYTMLNVIEEFAEFNNFPFSDEESVSRQFNEFVRPSVVEAYSEDDEVAINEAFNNWTDGLCKDGDLHEEQYNNYTYLGKHA